jgi:ligand-binding sensor domain-containing protein
VLFRPLAAKLLFLLLLTTFVVKGQQPAMRNFQVKDGLPSSEVYDVMQDQRGYMWFCTDAGVCRYDGYTFKTFSAENGLPDNTVFGSYEDRKGRIWFRSLSGKLSYFKNDSIISIGGNQKMASLIQSSIITSLYVDAGDTIWCGISQGKGYVTIAPPYGNKEVVSHEMKEATIYLVQPDSKGFVFGVATGLPTGIPASASGRSLIAKLDKKGQGPFLEGPTLYRPQSVTLKTKNKGFVVTGESDICYLGANKDFSVPLTPISLYEDSNEALWVGLYKNGVQVYAKGNMQAKPEQYLKGISVTGIEQDSEGGYWFTTLENGVYYLSSLGILYYDINAGLQDNKVLTLIPCDSASIFAGTSNGSLDIITRSGITDCNKTLKIQIKNSIYVLQKTPSGSLLVGAANSYIVDLKGGKPPVEILTDKIKTSIKCFTTDKTGQLWGGNYRHLLKIDPVTGTTVVEIATPSRILSLYSDEENNIWLGCVNGLWKYKNKTLNYLGDSLALFKSRIEAIKLAPDGSLWFATKDHGLIHKKGKQIFSYTKSQGLSSNTCKSIFPDKNGIVWVGTNKGINKLSPQKGAEYSCESYTSKDGLISNEINEVALAGDDLWAATNLGIVFFNTKASLLKKSPPPIYITGLTINNDKKELSESYNLRYFQNYLHIDFIGLSFKSSTGLDYRYKLEGLDSTWNHTHNSSIQYTTLPPGTYTFKIFAINQDGLSSMQPAVLHFFIAKPFWLEKWFLVLVSLITSASIVFAYKKRLQVLKQRAIKSAEVSRKIAEMELKALKAQMNPHFIFNSIASIQHFIWKNNPDEADKYLSKFSKLIRNVLINSTHEYISLEVELQTLELYIQLERLRFSSGFTYILVVDESISKEQAQIPPLIIQPYVENAIWHGLMHLNGKVGELKIEVKKTGNSLKCSIDDNGIGRNQSMSIKKASKHRSLGLSITKERLENLNTLYQSNLSVEIIDKYLENGSPAGTTVNIFIPLSLK